MRARELSLADVALRLGDQEVLRGVSLVVRPGEVVGLVGPNGAGKTSLLRVATGTVVPDSGAVRLGETPLGDLSRREAARAIAMVAQELHVPFPFRVGELVLMGRSPHQSLFGFETGGDLERARAAMARIGIEELADRSILELSGGERQLSLLAMALTQDPELLLLDEPTAFLDLRHRTEVMRVVRGLAAEGHGALVVSHDLNLAARACDRLLLLADGRVVASGAPREVLTRETLREAFAMEAELTQGPDDLPLLVPQLR